MENSQDVELSYKNQTLMIMVNLCRRFLLKDKIVIFYDKIICQNLINIRK